KWISTIGDGYNTLSPILYEDGYIYTGSGPNASNEGRYVGIKVQDLDPDSATEENAPVWKHESNSGYYWSGGAIVDGVIVFAGDDGQLVSADLKTGQEVDTLALGGQIRNSVVYDSESGKLVIGAKNSKVHAVELKTDGSFDDATYMTADLPAQSTSPVIVYNDRVYIGSGQMSQGSITVLNLNDLSEIYTANVGSGGIQGGLLATTAYGTDANKHQINIYFTRNSNPGGLYMITDYEGNTAAPEVTDIYIPTDKNYCLSSPIADKDGSIYYSNDSGYLFALSFEKEIVLDELDAYWSSYRKNTNNMALLDIKLPENQAQAIEAWKEKLSLDWSAISTPLIVEDKVYVVCGKTLSVFDKDGNTLNSMTLEGSTSWYASFLASGGGLIYAHIGNGKIQAVDAKTLESKWISTIGDGYNTLSPIVYKEGYIYTGSGPNASNEGAYVGIKVQDKDPNSGTEENT
ncbi:MAG: hypothetical protein JXO44_14125, partial [Clostridia bacterium]|nr:hypothetical protein [Clostridia bacterium]